MALVESSPASFEYQGVMGCDWHTQWFKPGEYCGSPGAATSNARVSHPCAS